MPKGSLLPTANSFTDGDYVFVISDPTTLATTKKLEKTVFFSNVSRISTNTLIIRGNSTPTNSTMTVTKGSMFYDDSYLYISTANNVIKRITLNSF